MITDLLGIFNIWCILLSVIVDGHSSSDFPMFQRQWEKVLGLVQSLKDGFYLEPFVVGRPADLTEGGGGDVASFFPLLFLHNRLS